MSLINDSNLNDRERNIIMMRYFEGLSIKECSERCGIEENSFKKCHKKVLHKLYAYMSVNGRLKELM